MEFDIQYNNIAQVRADAIVLPANWRLVMGTGASMALFEAAGKDQLEEECTIMREKAQAKGTRLEPGISIATHAFDLPADFILHTIVPKWDDKNPRKSYDDLCKAYSSALFLADKLECESIAFPVLASGNNKFDADVALEIALQSLIQYAPMGSLKLAHLVTYGDEMTQRARNRGYYVEDYIGQRAVFEQEMHQAKVWKTERDRIYGTKEQHVPPKRNLVDVGIDWICDPDNQRIVLDFAEFIIDTVLPDNNAARKTRDFLNIISPIIRKNKK